jgi:hypothetical protein
MAGVRPARGGGETVMRVVGPAILAVALAATAGCGSGAGEAATAHAAPSATATSPVPSTGAPAPSSGSKADIAAITKLAKAIDAGKAATVCRTMLTPAMVKTVFGDLSTCLAADDGDEHPTTGATVTAVQVSGARASAVVTDRGGSSDGATGTWHFERTGKTWRLAAWGVDYLRAQFDLKFGPRYRAEGAEDPFADTAYRMCIHDAFLAADDDTVQAVAYGLQQGRNTKTGPLFATCSTKATGGTSPFRKSFEDGVRAQMHAFGAPTEAADCVVDKLRTVLDEAVLINAVLDGPGSKQLNKVSTTVTNASRACAKGSTGLQPTIRAPKHRYAIHPLH